MSTTTGTKRPKLDDEGSTMVSTSTSASTSTNNPYGMILELAMPFLSVDDDLFTNICLVSKSIHQQCLKLFHQHCEDHYPMLIFMEQTQMQTGNQNEAKNDSGKTYDESDNGNKRWLTYKRYRSYREETKPKYQYDDSRLAEYELILEISTASEADTEEEEPNSDSDSATSSSPSSSSSSTNIMGEDAGKKKRSRGRQICESKQAEEEHFGEDGGTQGHKRTDQSLRNTPVALTPKPREMLLAHDIQPLCAMPGCFVGCTFRVDKFPCSNKEMREGIVKELLYRVRVIMRRKSTGQVVIVMNTTKDICQCSEPRTDFWHSFIYKGDEWCSEDGQRSFYADLTFNRFRTSTGEVAFQPDTKVVEDDDSDVENYGPVEIRFHFDDGYPENILEAIDAWRWL